MGQAVDFFAGACMLTLGLGLASCNKHDPKPVPATSAPTPTPAPSASGPREWTLPSVKSEERDEAPDAPRVDGGAFAAGVLNDIGPAAPASASRFGVVFVTKLDEIVLAKPGKQKGSFKSIPLVASTFNEAQQPPAIAGEFAYFVSHGKLVRRPVPTLGPIENLGDPRDNTRVSALPATATHPAAVAYIANPDKPSGSAMAMLWVEGHDSLRLTPEGAGASSVSLAETGNDLLVAVLDGRTGMTPVHTRKVTFADKQPTLGENIVVWVAGPAQPTTELTLMATAKDAWIFSPLERATTRFGLAEAHIGVTPTMGSPVEWRMYPNGIDPAPVASVHACGRDLLVYTRPSTETPGAPQELQLAAVGDSGLESPDVLAKAPAIRSVSASATDDGLLVVYVASGRTWALSSACSDSKKK